MMEKKALICILNYNGSKDTIECIESLYKFEDKNDYTVVILDNDSEQEQYDILIHGIEKIKGINMVLCSYEQYALLRNVTAYDVIIVQNSENVGFAKGNNMIINPHKQSFQFVVLLNNDTVITSNSTKQLLQYMNEHDEIYVATTIIYYYYNQSLIWNAGGKIHFGTRKYYINKHVNRLKKKGNAACVDYITGCYFCIRSKEISKEGLFTERFFLGEEDYNFAMNAKRQKRKMEVLLDYSILHKVHASTNRGVQELNLFKLGFVHHLNRFIDMKFFYRMPLWNVWRLISSIYIYYSVYRRTRNRELTKQYVEDLNYLSNIMNSVDKEDFFLIREGRITDVYKKHDYYES